MRNLLGSLGITGADVQKFKIEAAAPVYGADGIASADSW
jgi:hypothetical protein